MFLKMVNLIEAFNDKCIIKDKNGQFDKANFDANCFVGDIKTLIPGLGLVADGESLQIELTVDVLVRLLVKPGAIQRGYKLKINGSEILLLKLESSIGKEYIVAVPFVSQGRVSLDLSISDQITILLRDEVVKDLFGEK